MGARIHMNRQTFSALVRNIVFGVEDSLVSTVGFLAGIASANVSRETLFLSGFILIAVEALSMGIGSLLAETTVEELGSSHVQTRTVMLSGVVMLVSYFFSGFIPLSPYLLFSGQSAFFISIILSLLALFILGWVSGRLGKRSCLRCGLRMMLLGGVAIIAGVGVGRVIVG